MRPAGAKRAGVEWADQGARADYGRKRERWTATLFKPAPEQKWCYQCGWRIKQGEAYSQHGPKRRVPGLDAKSDYVCWWCPWAGPLDTQAILDRLTPEAVHLARLWATHIDQRRVSLHEGWQITSAHGSDLEFPAWWSSVEALVSRGVLRIPAGTNDCGMPPVYVAELVR